MKYIPNALDTQSRSSLLILYIIFENCGSWQDVEQIWLQNYKITFMKFGT